MGRPYGKWLGEYNHLPNVPRPEDPQNPPLSSTLTEHYPSSFYVIWVRERHNAALFGTSKGAGLQFDVLDREEMKRDESKRPDNEFVNALLKEEGICRQYTLRV
jgi:hypothetical protein